MVESRMAGSGIHQIGRSKLTYIAKSLEYRGVVEEGPQFLR